MTDNEIIKALEIHGNEKYDNCEGCPYLKGDCCTGFVAHSKPYRDVADLINRQKAEIEGLISGQETLQKHIAEKDAEIEALQFSVQSLSGFLQTAKAETIKEFADRLKRWQQYSDDYECYVVTFVDIDNLVKEMGGEI